MTRRTGYIALGVLALAALIAAATWWLRTHERVEEWVDLPRTGEARTNPLYVLKLALRLDGVQVQARQRLQRDEHRLGERDTVLLFNDPRSIGRDDARALVDWVGRGGHLLIRTPEPGPYPNTTRVPMLDLLEVAPSLQGPRCVGWDVPGDDRHVEFCRGRRFTLRGTGPSQVVRWGDADRGDVYARLAHGRGHVDVVADFDFLENDKLKEGPHIALARQLLAPNYGAGTVHLIYAAQMPSFWWTLATQSWMAWLPLVLTLLAWLWWRMQRFGPLRPAPAHERRSLLEHIDASGAHTFRYGYAHLLHEAARNAFLARLRRRDPQAAALTGDVQAQMLAERFGLPAESIRDAMTSPLSRDPAALRSRIALLMRMRNALGHAPSNPQEPRP